MAQWKHRLNAIANHYSTVDDRFDLLRISKILAEYAAEWLKEGAYDIQEGNHITLPLETKEYMTITFYSDSFSVTKHDEHKYYEEELLPRTKFDEIDEGVFQSIYLSQKHIQKGLGAPVPSDFTMFFNGLQKGDIVSFNGGETFMCGNHGPYDTDIWAYTINPKCRDSAPSYKHIAFDDFHDRRYSPFVEEDCQKFFVKNRQSMYGSYSANIISKKQIDKKIKKITKGLSFGQTKTMQWGSDTVTVTNTSNFVDLLLDGIKYKPKYKWEINGREAGDIAIQTYLGHYMGSPILKDVECDNTVDELDVSAMLMDNNSLIEDWGPHFNDFFAKLMFAHMKQKLTDIPQMKAICLSTFEADNSDNFLPVTFKIALKDNDMSITKTMTSQENPNKTTEQAMSIDEFISWTTHNFSAKKTQHAVYYTQGMPKIVIPQTKIPSNKPEMTLEDIIRNFGHNKQTPMLSINKANPNKYDDKANPNYDDKEVL